MTPKEIEAMKIRVDRIEGRLEIALNSIETLNLLVTHSTVGEITPKAQRLRPGVIAERMHTRG